MPWQAQLHVHHNRNLGEGSCHNFGLVVCLKCACVLALQPVSLLAVKWQHGLLCVSLCVCYRGRSDRHIVLWSWGNSHPSQDPVLHQSRWIYREAACSIKDTCSGCFCCTRHHTLSKVRSVEVIEDEVMKYLPDSEIKLSPGLRVGIIPDITILVSTPEAVQFSQQLKTASNLV